MIDPIGPIQWQAWADQLREIAHGMAASTQTDRDVAADRCMGLAQYCTECAAHERDKLRLAESKGDE